MTDERIIEEMARAICLNGTCWSGDCKKANSCLAPVVNLLSDLSNRKKRIIAALAAYREIAGDEIAALRERAENAERERDQAEAEVARLKEELRSIGTIYIFELSKGFAHIAERMQATALAALGEEKKS